MKLIITALRQEARPLIQNLGLKQDPASSKIPVYSSGDTLLVISGIGKLNGAIATTYGLHRVGELQNCFLINVGMCGAVVDRINLGEAVMVHKIWDHGSNREFFPDVLLKHSLQEASLGTFDQPVKAANHQHPTCDVVDMEASGIFQAGRCFLSPHQMLFIKVATDYLDFSGKDYPRMLQYYGQSIETWLPMLDHTVNLKSAEPVLSAEQESFLNSVVENLRLTRTQSFQLRDSALGFLVRGGKDLDLLKLQARKEPNHKALRNQVFKSMIQTLNQV